MKNPKSSAGKHSSSHRPPPSSTSAAASNRKSRWESSDQPSTPSDSKPSKSSNPKEDHPSSSAAAGPPSMHSLAANASASPFPFPPPAAAPAPPTYSFHNLERRTIILADGSVRSYFALPPDYPLEPYGPPGGRPGLGHGPEPGLGLGFDRRFSPDDFREPPPKPYGRPGGSERDYWSSLGLDGPRAGLPEGGPSSLKRKYGDEDEFAWHRQHVMQYGNPSPNANPNPNLSPMRRDHHEDMRLSKQVKRGLDELPPAVVDVDPLALRKAFLRLSKSINENASQRKNYLDDGRNGPLQCIVCGRASKEFADVHGLIMHAYNTQNADLRVDHLGLHKALCILMGWNYAKAPENSKAYQSLSADNASENREDLILWPPTVIIHNTSLGRRKDGRMEGMGNKEMDMKLKDLGFSGGKSKSVFGKDGHLGITVVRFASTQAGLKEAEHLAEYFSKDNHGRTGWARVQASQSSGDEEKNPALVKVDEKSGEKKKILYGYLATVSDLEKVDFDMRKKAVLKSRRDFDPSD